MKQRLLLLRLLVNIFALVAFATSTLAALQLPSKLAQLPIYSGAKIVQVMDMGDNSMAMLEVKAGDIQALMKFYKQEMEGKGWKTIFQAEQEDNAVIHFTKDKLTVQISANKDGENMLSYHMMLMGS